MVDWILNNLNAILSWIVQLLPLSPFAELNPPAQVTQILGILNWIVPVGKIGVTGAAWLVCVSIYYVYMVILRWAKIAGGD